MAENYDAIVIGTGQSGKPLAFDLAKNDCSTAVIERDAVGGSCVNYGCTPTKTMVASGKVKYYADRSEDYGINTGEASVNMEEVIKRKQKVVDMFREGSEKGLEQSENIDLIRGEARFTDDRTVQVDLDDGDAIELTSPRIFINTGLRPRIPDVDGLQNIDYLTSTSIMEVTEVPEHLVVIGGGYIGLEFGQMFRRFGSDVTILQRSDQLIPREDEDIGNEIKEILEKDGIRILLEAEADRIETDGNRFTVTVDCPDGSESITGDELLLAAGRVPTTDKLGLENTGIQTNDRGYIQVDEKLETDVDNVFCVGDVKGGPAFTHISYDDYRVVRDNVLHDQSTTIEDRMVPYTLFTDPELGRIGLNEKMAKKQNISYRLAEQPMSHVARAIERSETRGTMKVLVDADSDRILGASILGIEGGEIASMIQIAMMGDLTYRDLEEGIFSHPTLAESLNNVFSNLEKNT